MHRNKQFKIIAIGETLWDYFGENKYPGGTATNFILQVKQLAQQAILVSATGRDQPGFELVQTLQSRGLDTGFIQQTLDHPTGSIKIELTANGHPVYHCSSSVAFDYLSFDPGWSNSFQDVDAVFFTAMGQRLPPARQAIQSFVQNARHSFKLFDCNIRNWNDQIESYIKKSFLLASAIKCNRSELEIVKTGLQQDRKSTRDFIDFLLNDFNLDFIAVTTGIKGSCLKFKQHHFIERPAVPVTAIDTTGAGDAFAAALVVSFLQKLAPEQMLEQANLLGGFCCTLPGASPEWHYNDLQKFANKQNLKLAIQEPG